MMFFVEEMSHVHISRIALLEKECFSLPWSEEALKEELSNPDSRFLVAVDNGSVAGYIGVQEICGEAYITNIAVFPEYRKKGIGRALLKSAAEGAKSRNCEFISLEVRVSNVPAVSLYEAEGFERMGIRKGFYSSPSEDGAIYTKYFTKEVSE